MQTEWGEMGGEGASSFWELVLGLRGSQEKAHDLQSWDESVHSTKPLYTIQAYNILG